MAKFNERNAIIDPPRNIDIPKQYYRYVISSRDRNIKLWPRQNQYEVHLDENVHDVISVELLKAKIPFTKYLINEYNCRLYFDNDFIELEPGSYVNIDDFTEELVIKFREKNIIAKIKKNERSKKIEFEFDRDICLKFKGLEMKNGYENVSNVLYKSTIGRILGFYQEDYEYKANTMYVAPYCWNIIPDDDIIMKLHGARINYGTSNILNGSFALLINSSRGENTSVISANNSSESHIKVFNPPISSMQKVKISFYDNDGNLYDFNNQDHYIELLFTCFKQTRKYNDIFVS